MTTRIPVHILVVCGLLTIMVLREPVRAPVLATEPSSPDRMYQQAERLVDSLKYEHAARLFSQASDQYYDQHNWVGYIACQRQLAWYLWTTHRGDEAVAWSRRTLTEAERLLGPCHMEIARLYTVLGNIYADRRTQEDYRKCLSYYEKALAITQQAYGNRHPALAGAYERLGIARFLADDYDGGIPFFKKALTFLEEPSRTNATLYAKIHNNLGLMYQGMGHFPRAQEHFEKALYFIRDVQGQNDSKAVKYLKNIAQVNTQMGNYDEALLLLEEAWALDQKVGEANSKLKAYLLESTGDSYLGRKAYRKAVGFYDQYLGYFDPCNRDDVNALVQAYTKIGTCYLNMRQTTSAFDYFLKALKLLDTHYAPDNFQRVKPLINLGSAYQQTSDIDLARKCVEEALLIARKKVGAHHPLIGEARQKLAEFALAENQTEEALRQAHLAEEAYLLNAPSAHPSPASVASGFGRRRPKPYDEGGSKSAHQPIVPSAYQVSDPPAYLALQSLIGDIRMQSYEMTGEPAELHGAMAAYRKGLAFSDSLKITLPFVDGFRQAQQEVHRLAEKALNGLYCLWLLSGQEEYAREAFLYFEKSKSAWLRHSVRDLYAKQFAGVTESAIDQELALKSKLAYSRNRFREFPDQFKHVGEQVAFYRTKQQLDSLLRLLEDEHPDYYQLKYNGYVATLDQAQAFADQSHTDMVTYFWGEQAVYLLGVVNGIVRWEKINDPARLANRLTEFRKALIPNRSRWQKDNDRRADFQAYCTQARSLFVTLLEPILQGHDSRRLLLLPDGPLGRFPFQALLDSAPDAKETGRLNYRNLPYLLRRRPVQYAYSATLLLSPPVRRKGQGYVGFSPSYSRPLTVGARPSISSNRTERQKSDFNLLPSNHAEIEETATLLGGRHVAGSRATEDAFRQAAGKAGILHLALHARIDDLEPDHSALLFAADPRRPADGYLYAYELYNLPLHAELAVLSACSTGDGQLQQGEGIISLSRAFHYAGCPATVMSLWPADDATSKDLVVGFFRNLAGKATKSEALRQSTLDFLASAKQDIRTRPAYWANFVVIGQDDPVALPYSSRSAFAITAASSRKGLSAERAMTENAATARRRSPKRR